MALRAPASSRSGFSASGCGHLGVNGALLLITMPQLLAAAQHAPENRIAAITAMALLSGFMSFLLAPLLDWRFSRRTWAVVFTVLTGFGSAAVLRVCPPAGGAGGVLLPLQSRRLPGRGGRLRRLVPGELVARERQLGRAGGAWLAAVNIASGGRRRGPRAGIPDLPRPAPEPLGALVLGSANLLVLPLLLTTPCPPADARLAREGVIAFATDVEPGGAAGRSCNSWTLFLFRLCARDRVRPDQFAVRASPAGFHTGEAMAGLIGGAGVCIARRCSGSLLVAAAEAGLRPRVLYIRAGLAWSEASASC